MNTLNYDITNHIIKQLPATERLRLYTVFNESKPTQFQVSFELMASKRLKGPDGLIRRALSDGEYEPCVQAMIVLKSLSLTPEKLTIYEGYLRSDFMNYDSYQLIDRVRFSLIDSHYLLPPTERLRLYI